MKNTLRVLIVGFLAMAVTLAIGVVAMGDSELTARFWMALSPAMLAELLITVSVAGILGKGKSKSFPMKMASQFLPWGYFIFTLVMIAVYGSELSNGGFLACQAVGLFLFLIPVVLCEMAGDAIGAIAAEQAMANANRVNFRLTLPPMIEQVCSRYPEDAALITSFEKCGEAVRYMADSPVGAEQVDAEVEKVLNAIADAMESPETLLTHSTMLLATLRKREAVIKTLR